MEKQKLFNIIAIVAVIIAFVVPLAFLGAGEKLAENNDAGFIEWYNSYRSIGQPTVSDYYTEDVANEDMAEDMSKARNGYLLGLATLIAPAITLLLAFLTKNVILSLFLGVLNGAWTSALLGGNILIAIRDAYLNTVDGCVATVADSWDAGIIMQVMVIGALIALITRMGGMSGIANFITKIAKGPRSAQVAIWLSSWVIFFDDYANALIIGPIMRPVCDKFRISREKLAYIVDSTAAPVAGIFIISTWIGTELVNIGDGLDGVALLAGSVDLTAMDVFVQTIPFRFYNIMALFLVLAIGILLRDYGPMLKAELRARTTGATINPGTESMDTEPVDEEKEEIKDDHGILKESKKVTPPKIMNAVVPILVLIVSAVFLFYTNGSGWDFSMSVMEAYGNADASVVLLEAGVLACIVAIIMGFCQKIFTLKDGIETWAHGMKSMVFVCIILVLAWTIGTIIKALGTQYFLVSALAPISWPVIMPAVIFLIAALISFATGTAYGTMAILTPLCMPFGYAIAVLHPTAFADPMYFMVICASAVLTGAIFGDHCSPISDSTILSTMGAGCSLMDHVTTQILYSFTVAADVVIGYILVGLGLPVWLVLIILAALLVIFLFVVGKKVPTWDGKSDSAPAEKADA